MFPRHRPRRRGTMELSAVLDASSLRAIVDASGVEAPVHRVTTLDTASDLEGLVARLTDWCHEHRVALSGGAFTSGLPGRRGSIPTRVHLSGDLVVEIGEGISTFSFARAMAHHQRTREAVAAYLRACAGLAEQLEPERAETRDARVENEIARAYAAGGYEGMLELIEEFHAGSRVSLHPTDLVVDHDDQGHHWIVTTPWNTAGDLRRAMERLDDWAARHDASIEATSTVALMPVLPDEFFIDLSWMAPREFDQELETVKWLAHQPPHPDNLLFRVTRDQMAVGIRHDAGRVWLLLEPKADRVVKSSDDAYVLSDGDLARIRRAASLRGAVEHELTVHRASGTT
jgi:hypothetical protein